MARTISNSDDIIDSRDVIARINELESDRQSLQDEADDPALDEDARQNAEDALAEWDGGDDGEELKALKALADEAEGYVEDWDHGAGLIRESYFTEYAQQYAEDIGAIKKNAEWPYDHIDWDAAADALRVDYTEVEYSGVAYLVR